MAEFTIGGQRVDIDTSDGPSPEELQKRIEEALTAQTVPTPAPAEAQEALQPEAVQAAEEEQGFLDNIAEIPEGIAAGATKALANTSSLIDRATDGKFNELGDWFNENVANLGYIQIDRKGRIAWTSDKIDTESPDEEDNPVELLNTTTITGDITEGIAQFMTGLAMTRGAGFAGNSTASLAGQAVVAENLAFDPWEDRLSNIIQDVPSLENPITEYLAADPDDSEVEARLKMSLEALGLEAVGIGLFAGIRAYRDYSKGLEADPEDVKEIEAWVDSQAPDLDVSISELDAKMDKAVEVEAKLRETYQRADANSHILAPETIAKIKSDARSEAVAANKAANTNEEWYHGTSNEFDTYEVPKVGRTADTGVWVTNSLDGAKRYASSRSQGTEGATPTVNTIDMSEVNNTASVTVDGKYSWFGVPENATITYADGSTKLLSDLPGLSKAEFDRGNVSTNDIARALKQEGLADSVVFKGVNDQANLNGSPSTKVTPAIDSMVIFDPSKVSNKVKVGGTEGASPDLIKRGQELYQYGVTKSNKELVREADDVIAELFVDSPSVMRGIESLNASLGPLKSDVFFTALGRVLQMTTRNLTQAHKGLKVAEEDLQSQFKQLDARTDLTPDEVVEFKRELQENFLTHQNNYRQVRNDYIESVMAFRGKAATAGREVQVNKLFQNFDVPPQQVEAHFDKLLRKIPNEKVRNSFVARAVFTLNKKTGDIFKALDEIFIANILTGFKTHVVNTVSNGATTLYLPLERMAAAGVRTLTGDAKGGAKQFRAAMATYAGMRHGLSESARLAAEAYRIGDTILDNNATYENQGRTVIGRDLPFEKKTLTELAKFIQLKESEITLADLLGTAMRALSTRALSTEDEFFKNMNFRSYTYGNAFADALDAARANGLKGKEASQYASEQAGTAVQRAVDEQMMLGRNNMPSDLGVENYRADALQYAREGTFTQDLSKGGRSFQGFVENVPLMRQLFPFVRTPLNLISASMQRSPLAPLSGRWRADLAAGGERQALALTRLALGTAIVTKFMADFSEQEMRFERTGEKDSVEFLGAGPTQVGARQNQQELSNKIFGAVVMPDGTQYQISRFDPFSTIFEGLGVIQDLQRNGQTQEADDLTLTYGLAIARMLGNDTYATSIRQVMYAMQDENGVDKFLKGRVSQLVPLSGFTKGYNQTIDPFQRELRSYTDAIMASLPGGSSTLAPRYNLLGEPVEAPKYATSGLLPEQLELMMSPIMAGKVKTDPVAVEVVNQNIGTVKQSPFLKGGAIDLNNPRFATDALGNPIYETNRTAYDRFNDIMANERLFGRYTLREFLDKTITSPAYQNKLTDSVRVDTPFGKKKSVMYEGSRKDILTAIIADAKEYALVRLRKENPNLDAALKLHEKNTGMSFSKSGQERMKELNAPLEGK